MIPGSHHAGDDHLPELVRKVKEVARNTLGLDGLTSHVSPRQWTASTMDSTGFRFTSRSTSLRGLAHSQQVDRVDKSTVGVYRIRIGSAEIRIGTPLPGSVYFGVQVVGLRVLAAPKGERAPVAMGVGS